MEKSRLKYVRGENGEKTRWHLRGWMDGERLTQVMNVFIYHLVPYEDAFPMLELRTDAEIVKIFTSFPRKICIEPLQRRFETKISCWTIARIPIIMTIDCKPREDVINYVSGIING